MVRQKTCETLDLSEKPLFLATYINKLRKKKKTFHNRMVY